MEKKSGHIKEYYTYITVFVTGAVVLVLEVLGTRFIAPYYGTTIYVWSSLIGVTLLGLAAGYFAGGWLADKSGSAAPMYYIILAASAAVYLIPFTAPFILRATNQFGPRIGSLASAAVLFIVPFILLGAVSPFAVRLSVGELKDTGMTAGSLYGISTVGSFLAAILTGFYLIPVVGSGYKRGPARVYFARVAVGDKKIKGSGGPDGVHNFHTWGRAAWRGAHYNAAHGCPL
jgi:MFS family permease